MPTEPRRLADRWPTSLPDRVWLPAVVAGLVAVAFVGALLVRNGGEVSALVHAGPPWTDRGAAPGSLVVQAPDEAFDGQFFYRIAVAPWSTETTVAGVTFDLPALRSARWGYGALAWVASGGDRDLAPWSLVGINVGAMAAVGALGGALARGVGRHALWGLTVALWPGFAYSLSLDTSELLASALVLGGLLAARRRRWWWAGSWLTLAVLVRDTTAVVPLGLLLAGGWAWIGAGERSGDQIDRAGGDDGDHDHDGRPTNEPTGRDGGLLLAGLVPLIAFAIWQLGQRARFGELPLTSSGDNNLDPPLVGLVRQAWRLAMPDSGAEGLRVLSALVLLGLIGAAAVVLRSSRAAVQEKAAWAPAVLVVVLMNVYLWSGATAFLRGSTEAGLLSILLLLGSRRRWTDLVAPVVAVTWAATAVAQLGKAG